METNQLALVMVAGIWAALNTLVSAYKVINDKPPPIDVGKRLDSPKIRHRYRFFDLCFCAFFDSISHK